MQNDWKAISPARSSKRPPGPFASAFVSEQAQVLAGMQSRLTTLDSVERRLHWVAAQLACLRDVAQIQDRTFSRPAAVAADEPKGKGRRRPPKDGAGQSANAQA